MVDLDKLSPSETVFVHKFLAHIKEHGTVSSEDFPDMDADRFDELAEAIMTEMNKTEDLH